MSNILRAILHIAKAFTDTAVTQQGISTNRINQMGEGLEALIKDAFSGSLGSDTASKPSLYSEVFSYLGNQNNPPDAMLRSGDAIEVKKIQSDTSTIALNSSYPKNKLFAHDPMLSKHCKEAELWTEKDVLYAIGTVKNQQLGQLWLVYGTCYAADAEHYEKIKHTLSKGIRSISHVEFAETKELGRVNKVDPLGITYLRVRGMWGIEHPSKVFKHIVPSNSLSQAAFHLIALIPFEKYQSFPLEDRQNIETTSGITVQDVTIQNPNNPAQLLPIKLIRWQA